MTGVAARNAPAVPTPRIPSEVTDLDRRSFRRASTLIAEQLSSPESCNLKGTIGAASEGFTRQARVLGLL